MNRKEVLLKKQGDFFFRIAELTYAGFGIGAFFAWAFEKKIGLLTLIGTLLIGMGLGFLFFYWGSKLYEKSFEGEEK